MVLRPQMARGGCLLWAASMVLLVRCTCAFALQTADLEGGRTYRVDKIVLSGNHAFSDQDLLSQMSTKERKFYLFWKKRPAFDSDVFSQDLKRLGLFYRSKGYFNAHITYDLKVHGDLITPEIKIVENHPVKVQRVTVVVDKRHLPRGSPLYKDIKLKPGDLFEDASYRGGQETLSDYYRNAGYAHVTTQRWAEVNVKDDAARVWYFAQPGSKGVFGKTTVKGAKTVAHNIVMRELDYKPGEMFSQRKLDKSRDRILKLGLFAVVRFTPRANPENPGVVPIRLTLRERPRHEITVGGGYNTESQFIANFSWHDLNWMGGGRRLTAFLRYSNIDSAARITLTQPYLFNSRATTGLLSFGEDIQQVPTYTLFGTRFLPSIKYAFSDTLKGFIGYRLEYGKLTSVDQEVIQELGGVKLSGIVSGPEAGLTLDTTNDLYNPSRGFVVDFHAMQAGEIFGGAFNFYRYWVQVKHYHLMPWQTILATRLKLGTGDYFGSSVRNYPLFYRFYAGGEGSVRGYRYWRLGPHTPDNTPLGGLTDFEGSIELRRHIWDKLSGAAFFDFGQLSTHAYDIPIRDLDFSAGPAVSYKTPVGPIRIDLGIPFMKPRGQTQWQVYFSIGQYF